MWNAEIPLPDQRMDLIGSSSGVTASCIEHATGRGHGVTVGDGPAAWLVGAKAIWMCGSRLAEPRRELAAAEPARPWQWRLEELLRLASY